MPCGVAAVGLVGIVLPSLATVYLLVAGASAELPAGGLDGVVVRSRDDRLTLCPRVLSRWVPGALVAR